MAHLLIDNPVWLADWAEAVALSADSRLTRGSFKRLLSRGMAEVDPQRIDLLTSDVLAEIGRRTARAGSAYPFTRTSRGFEPTGDVTARCLYQFLLLMSLDRESRKRQPGRLPDAFWPDRVFEHIVRAALEAWSGGVAFVFSEMPPAPPHGFKQALRALGDELRVDVYPMRAKPERKDHGLDVVAWRPFADRRLGLPLLMCQCTLSESGLIPKAREVVRAEWGELMDVPQDCIDRSLAIPHVIPPAHPDWRDLKRNTDLILDRLRIVELLGRLDSLTEVLTPSLIDRIQDLLASWFRGQQEIVGN